MERGAWSRDAHNNIVNILQYALLAIQYIAILVYANTIYWYCDLIQYNILYCQDSQYNILYCHDEPIQYIVLSGQSNTIYCLQYIAIQYILLHILRYSSISTVLYSEYTSNTKQPLLLHVSASQYYATTFTTLYNILQYEYLLTTIQYIGIAR